MPQLESPHATTTKSMPQLESKRAERSRMMQERSLVLQLRPGVAKKKKMLHSQDDDLVHVTSHGCLPEGTPKRSWALIVT